MNKIRKIFTLLCTASLCLSLTACAGKANHAVDSFDTSTIPEDKEISSLVPAKNKELLKVAIDSPYIPAGFFDDKNQATGYEVDVVRALARVLGIKNVQFSDVDFDSILSQVDNGTYDMAAAAMTVKKSRMRDLNMVAYIQSGFIYGTQKNNPKNFDYGDPCGFTIAAKSNTSQEELLHDLSETCKETGKTAIKIVADKDQDKLINEVADGSIDAIIGESAIIKYAETRNKNFASVGESFQMAPQGLATAKNNEPLAKATQAGLQKLMDQGILKQVMAPWGVESFALNYATLNPPIA